MENTQEKQRIFLEAVRTGLITITAGCETITFELPIEHRFDLALLLQFPGYGDQSPAEYSQEFRKAYLDAIFGK